jgi:hypothetical protein
MVLIPSNILKTFQYRTQTGGTFSDTLIIYIMMLVVSELIPGNTGSQFGKQQIIVFIYFQQTLLEFNMVKTFMKRLVKLLIIFKPKIL